MKHDWIHPVSVFLIGELESGEKTASELSKLLAFPYNLVYRRAKSLERAGLIQARRGGKGIVFSLKDDIAVRILLALSEALKFRSALEAANPKVRAAAMEVIEALKRKPPHVSMDLYFYGSFARGTSRRGSDVDVVVVVPKNYVKEIEAEISDFLVAHTFVIDRETFEKKVQQAGPHIRSVLAGIHLKLPLF